MKKITDRERVRSLVEAYTLDRIFDTADITFEAFSYEKGELLTRQDQKVEWLQFIVEGTVRVYGIRENGGLTPVSIQKAPTIIGDMEFSAEETAPFYTEAETDVLALAVSMVRYRKELDRDVTFLHVMLKSYSEKLLRFRTVDLPAQSLEERVLLYLGTPMAADGIDGTEKAALILHCSRRQLQRVLKKLCESGEVEKTGRGKYRIARDSS